MLCVVTPPCFSASDRGQTGGQHPGLWAGPRLQPAEAGAQPPHRSPGAPEPVRRKAQKASKLSVHSVLPTLMHLKCGPQQ